MRKLIHLCAQILLLLDSCKLNAQTEINKSQILNTRQKSFVIISSLTAKGNLTELKPALSNGLDAGLTINEIKEIMVQLYAYCGFPRSLNAINTFIIVTNERKAKGMNDSIGAEPSSLQNDTDKYEIGKKNLELLTGRMETKAKAGYATFVPIIDTFLKEHLFADIFDRGILTYQERELITISALTSLGGVDPQLQAHLSISLRLGFTKTQLQQLFTIVETSVGKKEAEAGRVVLAKVIADRSQTK